MPRPARRRLRPARDGVRDRGIVVRRMGSWRPVVGTHRPRKMEPGQSCREMEDPDAGHHRREGFPYPLQPGSCGLHRAPAPRRPLTAPRLPRRKPLGAERREQRPVAPDGVRSEEHTSELQSLMRISYAVFCLKKKKRTNTNLTKPL